VSPPDEPDDTIQCEAVYTRRSDSFVSVEYTGVFVGFYVVYNMFFRLVRRVVWLIDWRAVRRGDSRVCISFAYIPKGLQHHSAMLFSGMSPPKFECQLR